MAQDQDSGNKTEAATPRRLREARKRGDVPKSRDLTNTLGLAFTMALVALVLDYSATSLATLTLDALAVDQGTFLIRLETLGRESLQVLLRLSALFLLPIAAFSLLVEFLQGGPILTLEKLTPRLEHLDPAAGVKRMLSTDNVVEVIKSIVKTAVLFLLGYLVVLSVLDQLTALPTATPMALVAAAMTIATRLFGWTLGIFLLVMALDFSYQHHAFARKMKMSVRDIRQEHKDSEGDPMIKGQRRQMHHEFAQQSATTAATGASVLVVNPVHVAIAINYDREHTPVPVVMAKGEDQLALSMRDAANRHHVPVLRNERLAHALLQQVEEGDYVPRALFDVVAEVIHWANRIRVEVASQNGNAVPRADDPFVPPPGEDLTEYPLGPPLNLRTET